MLGLRRAGPPDVAGPWQLLSPRRLAAIAGLLLLAGRQIVAANLRLARLIWDPRLPLRSGIAIAALLIVRLAAGPTICDRIVALNTMSTRAVPASCDHAAAGCRWVS